METLESRKAFSQEALQDAIVRRQFEQEPRLLQEKTASFILETMMAARDLKQMCDCRRAAGHSTPGLEDTIAHATELIHNHFRKTFGVPFPNAPQ